MKVPQLTITRAANGLFIAPSAASELYQGGPWVADTVAQGLARIGMEMFGEKSQRNEGSRSMGLIDETHAVGVLLFFGAPSYVSKALGVTPEAAKVAANPVNPASQTHWLVCRNSTRRYFCLTECCIPAALFR